MKLNSLNLEAFYMAAKLEHFTLASESLGITQSALSQRIAKLEQELETSLFIRDKKSIKLTEPGFRLLRYCQIQDGLERDILKQFQDQSIELSGPLNIGCFSSIGRSLLIPSLSKLLQDNPMLSLSLINLEIDDLLGSLKSSESDYIVTSIDAKTNDIESHFLGFEENVLVRSNRLKNEDTFLDHDSTDETTKLFFQKNKLHFQPKNFHYLDDVYGLIDGVSQGLGQAVLPTHLIKNHKALKVVNPSKKLKIPIYLQYFKQTYYRKRHKEVITHIIDYFQSQLSLK